MSLDIKIHSDIISIKDTVHDLDISESKWNFLFDFLLETYHHAYFKGFRLYHVDHELVTVLNAVIEKILMDSDTDHFHILIKINLANLLLSRKLISKLWMYYEFPSIIFSKSLSQEVDIVKAVDNGKITHDLDTLTSISRIFRQGEQDVLWVKSCDEIDFLIS